MILRLLALSLSCIFLVSCGENHHTSNSENDDIGNDHIGLITTTTTTQPVVTTTTQLIVITTTTSTTAQLEATTTTTSTTTTLPSNKGQALILASREGHLEIAKALIANGANVNHQNDYGNTALIEASNKSHLEIVKVLIDAGADVDHQNESGRTALTYASDLEVVKTLIVANANMNLQDNRGWTALMYASYQGHLEIVKKLIASGDNVNLQNDNGQTALNLTSDPEIIRVLQEAVTPTTTTTTSTTTTQPIITTTTTTSTTTIPLHIRKPEREGRVITSCQNNSNYNACILQEDSSRVNNYAVNILDTVNNFLENSSYKITIEGLTRATLLNGKWTKSYNSDSNYTVSQANLYHWLMYQKEWMELNANTWYASGKGITAAIEDRTNGSAFWSSSFNKMRFPREQNLFWALFHEAGHANLSYSKGSYIYGEKYQACSSDTGSTANQCCETYKGCFDAINEGQAEFHQYLIKSNDTIVDLNHRVRNRCGFFTSITLQSTANNIYNTCDSSYPSGQIHTVGFLVYTTIWSQIFEHSDTNKRDIAVLFSEHLPLLSGNDDFETAGVKIHNLSQQLYDGDKADEYAQIIKNIFSNRGLPLPIE